MFSSGTQLISVASNATRNATRTATGLWKLGGSNLGSGGGGGTAAANSEKTGTGCVSTSGNSLVGLPHLWQKSEPGTSGVPQEQMSAITTFSVTQSRSGKQAAPRAASVRNRSCVLGLQAWTRSGSLACSTPP